MRCMLLFGLLLLPAAAMAAEDAPPPGSEVRPELQVEPHKSEAPSPEVTIKRRGAETIEEYSVSGRVYMVKVTPAVGPAYYLVDPTGNGEFSQQINDIKNPPPVPRWILLRW